MPKRKSDKKLAYYREKIRKIQEKESKKTQRRLRVLLSDSSDSEENANIGLLPCGNVSPAHIEMATNDEQSQHSQPGDGETSPETPATAPPPTDAPGEDDVTTVPELDPEILQALGAKTGDDPVYGDKIHENLPQLWLPLLKKGMSKEDKETILKQYLIPQNCTLLQAPKLNLEISAALTDSARNKDKKLVVHQQQLGHGITAINRAMDLLLNKECDGKLDAIKHLSNACRILCDLHYGNSQVRVKLITPSLDKSFINVVQDCHRDDTLFGAKLSEKIKSSKTIEKQGLQIKKVVAATHAPIATTSRPGQNRGNWSGPPRYPSNKSGRGGNKRAASARKPAPQSHPPPQTRQATKHQQARAQSQH